MTFSNRVVSTGCAVSDCAAAPPDEAVRLVGVGVENDGKRMVHMVRSDRFLPEPTSMTNV